MPMGARPKRRPAQAEEFRQSERQPGDEAACMRPIGHPCIRRGPKAPHHLQAKPDAQHDPGRDRKDAEEDDEDKQNVDARLWEEKQIAAHHACDCTRGANGGHLAAGIHGNMGEARKEACGKVEGEKAAVAHLVFQIVAKNPQKQHVACEMHQATVQEHRREEAADGAIFGDCDGEERPAAKEGVEGAFVGKERPVAQEDDDIGGNEAPRDPRGVAGGVVIADRKHGRAFLRAGCQAPMARVAATARRQRAWAVSRWAASDWGEKRRSGVQFWAKPAGSGQRPAR